MMMWPCLGGGCFPCVSGWDQVAVAESRPHKSISVTVALFGIVIPIRWHKLFILAHKSQCAIKKLTAKTISNRLNADSVAMIHNKTVFY